MRAVCQRVSKARVTVADVVVGEVAVGLVVLVGFARDDSPQEAERLAGKVSRLRVFEDELGKFDRSLVDVVGAALVVSQFTLIADTRRGNRPIFAGASAGRPLAILQTPHFERFAKWACGPIFYESRARLSLVWAQDSNGQGA